MHMYIFFFLQLVLTLLRKIYCWTDLNLKFRWIKQWYWNHFYIMVPSYPHYRFNWVAFTLCFGSWSAIWSNILSFLHNLDEPEYSIVWYTSLYTYTLLSAITSLNTSEPILLATINANGNTASNMLGILVWFELWTVPHIHSFLFSSFCYKFIFVLCVQTKKLF